LRNGILAQISTIAPKYGISTGNPAGVVELHAEHYCQPSRWVGVMSAGIHPVITG
jgi:hypothetical protein